MQIKCNKNILTIKIDPDLGATLFHIELDLTGFIRASCKAINWWNNATLSANR